MTTKRKYIRVKDTKHENVRRYLADKPNSSVADVMSAFAVSQSYAYQLMRDPAGTQGAWRSAVEVRRCRMNQAGRSDGSTADYYVLPASARELQDLISHKNMNAQIGEIFRSCYRFGEASHSNQLRDAKKIKFYIDAEVSRLEGVEG
jgi:hypothetical protein